MLKYISIATACLCTIAVVGHPYLQPIEPSNTPDITLLPSKNGQINLDGNTFLLLPNGNRKSLQVVDQQLMEVIGRFEAKPGNKLMYEYLPTSLRENVKELAKQAISTKARLDVLESLIAQQGEMIRKNTTDLLKIEKLGKIEIVSKRVLTERGSSGVEVSCPNGYVLLGIQCLAEIKKNGNDYWQFTNTWKELNKANCANAWPPRWVNAIAYCFDTGFRKIRD